MKSRKLTTAKVSRGLGSASPISHDKGKSKQAPAKRLVATRKASRLKTKTTTTIEGVNPSLLAAAKQALATGLLPDRSLSELVTRLVTEAANSGAVGLLPDSGALLKIAQATKTGTPAAKRAWLGYVLAVDAEERQKTRAPQRPLLARTLWANECSGETGAKYVLRLEVFAGNDNDMLNPEQASVLELEPGSASAFLQVVRERGLSLDRLLAEAIDARMQAIIALDDQTPEVGAGGKTSSPLDWWPLDAVRAGIGRLAREAGAEMLHRCAREEWANQGRALAALAGPEAMPSMLEFATCSLRSESIACEVWKMVATSDGDPKAPMKGSKGARNVLAAAIKEGRWPEYWQREFSEEGK